ncbi:MAG: type II toxin-antitoxin system RelE/ParE family toxin [Thermosynechococcaceae cyanobacterium]
MNSYSFSEKAVQDLDYICGYIAQQNPTAASKLFDAIRQNVGRWLNFPYWEIPMIPYPKIYVASALVTTSSSTIPDLTGSILPVL